MHVASRNGWADGLAWVRGWCHDRVAARIGWAVGLAHSSFRSFFTLFFLTLLAGHAGYTCGGGRYVRSISARGNAERPLEV